MGSDSLWREVSDEEKVGIEFDIKHLLHEFASKLESKKLPKVSSRLVNASRLEGDGWRTDSLFRDVLFLNAPFVADDLLIAEKGKWKKK